MKARAYGISDQGLIRQSNEDALFLDEAHQVYAVADGLGGLPGGAETSQRIVDLLDQSFNGMNHESERPDLGELVIEINRIVSKEGLDAHPFTGSGSTLTITQLVESQLFIAHVGDSAAYALRDGSFEKLTIDHTMAQELVDRIGEQAHATMPPEYPHTLTRCIGQIDELRVDQTRVSVHAGDRLLVCSDGLNKVLSNDQLQELLAQGDNPQSICEAMVAAANANKGPDNITLIVILLDN
ncbi:PP2C family protein-serine/threonine phosphatase [Coraliomargarita akajimensis]|uniref:Protein serine/threonine phosphatase n=1 Tax=Coraliomargarita akajimensis (strain DSM 45221 / IAM 15411 / JCM 23193 / KCTC 12865 / 04OKA010-24) TaxID=583355 RepID=D5EJI3_CORAD|nr:protein phosphatase 2C domain-containing protein [Coraliomargarita akajimensis]ADE54582.1 protein serine/threonine phosphatase [Coraliomargarita akajimensis DSM 45221]